jgi:hypothetical protein
VLLFAAAMPAIGAVFLRVYENTLVRQTEAELTAQGAALAIGRRQSVARRGARPDPGRPRRPRRARLLPPEPTSVDLRSSPVLPERPAASARRAGRSPALAAALLEPIFDRPAAAPWPRS